MRLAFQPGWIPASRTALKHTTGWIANLSRTGMLVTDAPMLPVGALCVFDFKLPNGEIVRGTAEVVRRAKPRRERVAGFALHFVNFEPGCQEVVTRPGATP